MASIDLSEIRELTNAELPQLNKLVSESFGYESPHSFFDDFPIWKSLIVKRFGIFSGNRLIAHAGIRFCEMQTDSGVNVPVAMIGAVATDEEFRGQGLSSRILTELCALSEQHHCDWTILWGSEHDFYKKFGFELQGEQFQGQLIELEDLPENAIPKIKRGWNHKIFEFLSHEKSGVLLKPEDHEWMSNHKTVNWFYQEEPFAFVGFERGLDLPHMIHEYGGDEKGLKLLFAFILSQDAETTLLGTQKSLLSFGIKEESLIEEYLCLARPHSKKPELKWQPDFWVQGLSAC